LKEIIRGAINQALVTPRTVPVRSLTEGWRYKILEWRAANTRYGRSIIVTVEDQGQHSAVFLPKRVGNQLTDKILEVLNQDPQPLYLVYGDGGLKERGTFKVSIEAE